MAGEVSSQDAPRLAHAPFTFLTTKLWCRLPGSNWAPTDYKSVALPNELRRRIKTIYYSTKYCDAIL